MLKIGITGGIGSGKSVVTRLFQQLGVPVFDSDAAARRLIDTDPGIIGQITQAFGPDAYLPENQGLDRKKIGSLVFQDREKLALLNEITHPPVIQAAGEWIRQRAADYDQAIKDWQKQKGIHQKSGQSTPPAPVGYIIKEAALLFESGTNTSLDFILGVYAPKDIRLERIMERDGLSYPAASNRIQQQMDEDQKMALCDGVIINDGRELLWPQVMAWHRQFQKRVLERSLQV